jgi:hypothetical protein
VALAGAVATAAVIVISMPDIAHYRRLRSM